MVTSCKEESHSVLI